MDKQGRLTRWDEWRVGERYSWSKGGTAEVKQAVCVEVNRARHRVVLDDSIPRGSNPTILKGERWANRYRPCGPMAPHRIPAPDPCDTCAGKGEKTAPLSYWPYYDRFKCPACLGTGLKIREAAAV